MRALGSMNKLASIVLLLAFSLTGFAENRDAKSVWSDGGRCAYEHMEIAITKSGEVWANQEVVGLDGLSDAIKFTKKAKSVKCIMVLADKPLTSDSPIVVQVMNVAKANHGNEVYLINEQ
jgi:biopolymer transport protein ExbD